MALYTATGDELKTLREAFPRCFGRVGKSPGVPVSVIREETRSNVLSLGIEKEGTSDFAYQAATWWWGSGVIVSHRIPVAYSWTWESDRLSSTLSGRRDDDYVPWLPFPKSVWDQIKAKPLAEGMKVAYNGELYIVVSYWDFGAKTLGKRIVKKEEPTIQVVHSSFIDLNS